MDDRKRTNCLGLMVILTAVWLLGVATPESLATQCTLTDVRISPISGHDFVCTGFNIENPTACYFKMHVYMNGDYPSPFHQVCEPCGADCDCTTNYDYIIPPNSTHHPGGVMTTCSSYPGCGNNNNTCDQGICVNNGAWCGSNSGCGGHDCIHPCTTVKVMQAKIFSASADGTTWTAVPDYPLSMCATTPNCLPASFNDVPGDGVSDCIPAANVAYMVDNSNGPQVISLPCSGLNCPQQDLDPCPAVTSCGGAGCFMGDPEEEVCDSTDTHQAECLEDGEPQSCPIGQTIHSDVCPCYPANPFVYCALSHQRWHCE
jgi:hypothetical protein